MPDQGLDQSDRDLPAGLVAPEVVMTAADHDLHFGSFASVVRNPTYLQAELHDGAGRVTLPGFYDGIHDRYLWQLPDRVARLLAGDVVSSTVLPDKGNS